MARSSRRGPSRAVAVRRSRPLVGTLALITGIWTPDPRAAPRGGAAAVRVPSYQLSRLSMPRTWWPGSMPSGRPAILQRARSSAPGRPGTGRPRPRRGRHRSPPPGRWPTPRSRRAPDGQPGVRLGRQLGKHRVRLLARRRLGRDGRRLHGVACHRQNELGAAYTSVGVGVTCSADQAWTVELFGYSSSDIPSANARAVHRTSIQGIRSRRPRSWPARRPEIRCTARVRPTAPTGRSRRPVAVPLPVPGARGGG